MNTLKNKLEQHEKPEKRGETKDIVRNVNNVSLEDVFSRS
jgi:hypothetical protein